MNEVAAIEATAAIACAKTSMPVLAVTVFGILVGSAGSRMARSGTMSAATIGYLMWFSGSVITEKAVISEAVPLVEGTAAKRALLRRGGMEPGVMMSANFSAGCS